jgi:hypothetical protein
MVRQHLTGEKILNNELGKAISIKVQDIGKVIEKEKSKNLAEYDQRLNENELFKKEIFKIYITD